MDYDVPEYGTVYTNEKDKNLFDSAILIYTIKICLRLNGNGSGKPFLTN